VDGRSVARSTLSGVSYLVSPPRCMRARISKKIKNRQTAKPGFPV
jgi:hypothetical protein